MSYEVYKPQIGFLAAVRFSVVVPEMRGRRRANLEGVEGEFSLKRYSRHYNFDVYARDLER